MDIIIISISKQKIEGDYKKMIIYTIEPEIVSALIAVIGVFLTAMVSFYIYKNQNWAKIVSQSRNKWIDGFRDDISVILATLRLLEQYYKNNSNDKKEESTSVCKSIINQNQTFICSKIFEAEEARARTLTRLNTSRKVGNFKNFPLDNVLRDIDFYEEVDNEIFDSLNDLTKEVLEQEWQRVKKEAKGKDKK